MRRVPDAGAGSSVPLHAPRRGPAVASWAGAVAVVLLMLAGCDGGSGALTTPTTPITTRASADDGVRVLQRAFEAGGGSGVVASKRYPGVL
jgi:hypothetical protein